MAPQNDSNFYEKYPSCHSERSEESPQPTLHAVGRGLAPAAKKHGRSIDLPCFLSFIIVNYSASMMSRISLSVWRIPSRAS